MKEFFIGGIQQMGIGVKDLKEAWSWYSRVFGMDCRMFEDETEAKLMLPYTGGTPQSRHAVLALNLQSGGGFEIWQYKGREPVAIGRELKLSDLGILVCKMKVKNIDEAYSFYKKDDSLSVTEPLADPANNRSFFIKDPFGNTFQMVEGNNWFMNENKVSGGSYGAIVGVSDIDKAKAVYCDILGYDEVVYDSTGIFPDFASLPDGNNKFRRILLKCSIPMTGNFSGLLGQSFIELVSSVDNTGQKTFKDRFWGDPGFIHLCFDIKGMDELRKYCSEKGFPFTVDSKQSHKGSSFDMGEAAGHFSYIEDPDGTLIEFVETHKIPILKKLGWYIDLNKRKKYKPLPKWILKTLRFARIKVK